MAKDSINGIIYKAQNKYNGKIYIGQTKHSLNTRRSGHESNALKCKELGKPLLYFQRALVDHGFENFNWSIIDHSSTRQELNYLERFYIDFFSSAIKECGYNLAMGGGFGDVNFETREKMKDSAKIRWSGAESEKKTVGDRFSKRNINCVWIHNSETEHYVLKDQVNDYLQKGYLKGRLAGIFNNNRKGKIYICRLVDDKYETKLLYPADAEKYLLEDWTRGCGFNKNPSIETRNKISKSKLGKESKNKGKICPQETRDRISKTLMGRTLSEECKRNISESQKGRKFSIEHRSKIGEANTGRKLSNESILKMKITKRTSSIEKQNIISSSSVLSNLTIKISEVLNLCQKND